MGHICFSYCNGKDPGAIRDLFPMWVQIYSRTNLGFRCRIQSDYHLSCHHIRHDDKCNHFRTSRPESQSLLGIKIGEAKTKFFSEKSTCSCHLEKIRRNRNCLFHSSFPYTNWWYFNHGFFRCEEKKNY